MGNAFLYGNNGGNSSLDYLINGGDNKVLECIVDESSSSIKKNDYVCLEQNMDNPIVNTKDYSIYGIKNRCFIDNDTEIIFTNSTAYPICIVRYPGTKDEYILAQLEYNQCPLNKIGVQLSPTKYLVLGEYNSSMSEESTSGGLCAFILTVDIENNYTMTKSSFTDIYNGSNNNAVDYIAALKLSNGKIFVYTYNYSSSSSSKRYIQCMLISMSDNDTISVEKYTHSKINSELVFNKGYNDGKLIQLSGDKVAFLQNSTSLVFTIQDEIIAGDINNDLIDLSTFNFSSFYYFSIDNHNVALLGQTSSSTSYVKTLIKIHSDDNGNLILTSISLPESLGAINSYQVDLLIHEDNICIYYNFGYYIIGKIADNIFTKNIEHEVDITISNNASYSQATRIYFNNNLFSIVSYASSTTSHQITLVNTIKEYNSTDNSPLGIALNSGVVGDTVRVLVTRSRYAVKIQSYTINSSNYVSKDNYTLLAMLSLDKPLLAILGVRGVDGDGVSWFNCYSWINFATNTIALPSSNTYSNYSCKDSVFSADNYYCIAPAIYNKIATDDDYTSSYKIIDVNNPAKIYVRISNDRKTLYLYGYTSSSYAYYNQQISSGRNTLYYITE